MTANTLLEHAGLCTKNKIYNWYCFCWIMNLKILMKCIHFFCYILMCIFYIYINKNYNMQNYIGFLWLKSEMKWLKIWVAIMNCSAFSIVMKITRYFYMVKLFTFHISKYYRSGVFTEAMDYEKLQLFYQTKCPTKQIIINRSNKFDVYRSNIKIVGQLSVSNICPSRRNGNSQRAVWHE